MKRGVKAIVCPVTRAVCGGQQKSEDVRGILIGIHPTRLRCSAPLMLAGAFRPRGVRLIGIVHTTSRPYAAQAQERCEDRPGAPPARDRPNEHCSLGLNAPGVNADEQVAGQS